MSNRASPPFPAWRTAGGLVFTSGQIALSPDSIPTPEGLRPAAPDCLTQARLCVDRLAEVLADAGSSLDRVVRIECFLARADDLPAWHTVFVERFSEPRPTRTTLVAAPPAMGFLIEIQAIATVG